MMSIPENPSSMGRILIEWAKGASRDFPWRHTTDPYSVLIAEKLLQQTSATNAVVRVFEEILQKYPTPKELSGADIDQLDDLVRPLGLAYRAKELRSLAIVLATTFDNQVPCDLKLRRPLSVRVAWSPEVGAYAAYEDYLGLWFGLGSSPEQAVHDLGEVMVSVYRDLVEDESLLADRLQRQLAALCRIIAPCLPK